MKSMKEIKEESGSKFEIGKKSKQYMEIKEKIISEKREKKLLKKQKQKEKKIKN